MSFHNNPSLKTENNEVTIKRYVHQPLTIDHNGTRVKIQEDGKVKIYGKPTLVPGSKDEYEHDEVEVSASLIFKVANALKLTRSEIYVGVSSTGKQSETE